MTSTFKCKCHWCGKQLIRAKQSVFVRLHFCDRQCKGEYQRTAKPVTREWLEDHYIVQGLDCTQIAHMVKRHPKSVWNWLKDFGIPRRPRGSDPRQHFKKGSVNAFSGRTHTPETRAKMSARAKATGRVPYDPSVGSYMKGRKGPNTPNWKGGITPERQALYSSREWKECVKSVWKRDNAICCRCGKDHRTISAKDRKRWGFALHHIVGFEVVELRCVVSNLVLLCRPCHLWVHSKKNVNKDFIKEI